MTLDEALRAVLTQAPPQDKEVSAANGNVQQLPPGGPLDRLEACMLLLHCLGRDPHERAWLLAHGSDAIESSTLHQFHSLCQQRRAGVPVAYLLGHTEFYGLRLHIDPRVLDPRDDTETLVDWALELLPPQGFCEAIDLGTGSGAIALALRKNRPACRVWAVDRSLDALALARQNGEALGLPVQWRHGHWLSAVPGQSFHLIVSNPPYLAGNDPHLPRLQHEPKGALVSGPEGLEDLRDIARTAPRHLHDKGWLLLEHGHEQAQAVQQLLRDQGFAAVQSRSDIAGILRCTGGQWLGVK